MRWWKIAAGLLLAGLAAGWCIQRLNRRQKALRAAERLKKIHLFF